MVDRTEIVYKTCIVNNVYSFTFAAASSYTNYAHSKLIV